MTLCIVWRQDDTIKFVSDSRISFGPRPPQDCGIKVLRLPFRVSAPTDQNGIAPPISTGELGLAIAGNAMSAYMVKEAIGEVIANMQGIPDYHDIGMDAIADVFFRGYKVIAKQMCISLGPDGRTCIVFAGHCVTQNRHRAFRMETDLSANMTCTETLLGNMDREVFGSGAAVADANKLLTPVLGDKQVVDVMQQIIANPIHEGVGGNIQFGQFHGTLFRPSGVATFKDGDDRWHYWRGPLDLNGPDFDQDGLNPLFSYLDLTA